MNKSSKTQRSIEVLDHILNMTERLMKVSDPKDFKSMAEDITDSMHSFKKVLKTNRHRISFPYMDVLNNEYKRYGNSHVAMMNNFSTENILLTPFDMLFKASQIVVSKNGEHYPYPDDLKIGNKAIGQAWLSDGTEVFSPREAIMESMHSTTKRLHEWALGMKRELQEKK